MALKDFKTIYHVIVFDVISQAIILDQKMVAKSREQVKLTAYLDTGVDDIDTVDLHITPIMEVRESLDE